MISGKCYPLIYTACQGVFHTPQFVVCRKRLGHCAARRMYVVMRAGGRGPLVFCGEGMTMVCMLLCSNPLAWTS